MIATTFLRSAADETLQNVLDTADMRHKVLQRTMEVTVNNLLGLTIKCARCHTHKYDPLPQEDYHRLLAFFTPAFDPQRWLQPAKREIPDVPLKSRARFTKRNAEIDKQVADRNRQIRLLLVESEVAASTSRQPSTRSPHFPARAKSVIFLMQPGGVSQMDVFDPKPELTKFGGLVHSEKVEMFQPGSETNTLLASPWKFAKHGQCGMDFSAALPKLATLADDLCMVRSMQSEHNNHTEALVMMTSGKIFPGRPTLGSWVSYGLGSENANLPAFIVLRDPKGYPGTGSTLWQNGWLPAIHRGTEFNAEGQPVLKLRPAKKLPSGTRESDRSARPGSQQIDV